VLVVDDDVSIRAWLTRVLEARGRTVAHADGVRSGRALLERMRPQLLIVDHGLPDGSGVRLLEEAAVRGVPAIVISGTGTSGQRLEAFRSGARDWLVKPFLAEELMHRLIRALGSGDARDSTPRRWAFSRWVFSVEDGWLWTPTGDLLVLPAAERRLLEILLRAGVRGVSRQQIAMNVPAWPWPMDSPLIDAVVGRLRSRLARHDDRPPVLRPRLLCVAEGRILLRADVEPPVTAA
jgi:DNA-binding response OmpR family regulator